MSDKPSLRTQKYLLECVEQQVNNIADEWQTTRPRILATWIKVAIRDLNLLLELAESSESIMAKAEAARTKELRQ